MKRKDQPHGGCGAGNITAKATCVIGQIGRCGDVIFENTKEYKAGHETLAWIYPLYKLWNRKHFCNLIK